MIFFNKYLVLAPLLLLASTTRIEALVTPVADNNPPTAVKKNTGTATSVTIDVLSNDAITPNGDITLAIVGAGTKGTFTVVGAVGSQQIQYTPTLNELGLDTVQYTATDIDGTSAAVDVTVQIFPDYSVALTGTPVKTFTSNSEANLKFSFAIGDDNDCSGGVGGTSCTFTPTLYKYDGAGGACDPTTILSVTEAVDGIGLATPVTWDSTNIVVQVDLDFAALDGAGVTNWWTDGTPDKLHFCMGVGNEVGGVTVSTELVKYDTDVNIDGSFDSNADSVTVSLTEKTVSSDTGNADFVATVEVTDCGLGSSVVAGSPLTLCVQTSTSGFAVTGIDSATVTGDAAQTIVTAGGTYNSNLVYEDCTTNAGVCALTFMVDIATTVTNGIVPTAGVNYVFAGAAVLGNGRRVMFRAMQEVQEKGDFSYNFLLEPAPEDDDSSVVSVFAGSATFAAVLMVMTL